MLDLFLPIGIAIINGIIQKMSDKSEMKKAWIAFVLAGAAEGKISVKLGKMAAEQRDHLAKGQWQKPGEDFSVPPKEKI